MSEHKLKAVIGVELDQSDKAEVTGQLKDMAKSAQGAASGTGATNESMEQLRNTMSQIRNLEVFELITDNADKVKKAVSGVKKQVQLATSGFKNAGREFKQAFDFKSFEGAETFGERAASAAIQLKESAKSVGSAFKSAGKASVEAIKSIGRALNSTIAEVALLVGALVGLVAAMRNALTVAQQLNATFYEAQKVGLSVSTYQELVYVFERVGVAADEVAGVMKTLTEEQVAVREGSEDMIAAFGRLGLSAEQVSNMSQEELFKETVKRLQNVTNATDRTTIAYQIFAEDAAHLQNILNLTNAEMQSMTNTFYALGGGASDALIEKSRTLSVSLQNMRTAWTGLKNTLAEAVMPILTTIVNALTKAIVVVNVFLRTIFGFEMATSGSSGGGVAGATDSVNDYTGSVENATAAVEKLKRSTMGFDELNIVSNPNSGSSGSAGGGGVDTGGAAWTPVDMGESVFGKANQELDKLREKVEDFVEKYKTQIQIIAAALGTLGVASLISSLGKALGLGDKFLGVMTNIKKLAATAITIVLQYELVNEFMDNFIEGEGIKEYIKGLLVSALGTAVLYAMWGPTGLAIGLAVTAVASLQAVVDNGGITNTESFVVALTGIAAAVGAVATAWKKAGLGNLIKGLVDKLPGFTGAFAGIGTTIGKHLGGLPGVVTKAFSGLGGIITKALGAVATAVAAIPGWAIALIAAIAAAIALAIVDYDFTDLGYKLGKALGTAWKKIKDWFGAAVEWVKALGESIKEGVVKAFEWVKEKFDINTVWDLLYYIFNPTALIAKLVEVMIEVGAEVLPGLWEGIKSGWNNLINNIKEFINGFVQGWKDALGIHSPSTVFAEIGKDLIAGLLNGISTAWTNIKNWFNQNVAPKLTLAYWQAKFDAVRQGATTKLGEARTAIMNAWNNIRTYFTSNIAPKFTVDYWKNKFDTMRAAITDKLGAVRTQVINSWNNIKSYFTTNIAPKFTKSYWVNKFETIRAAASEKLNAAKTVITNAWNNIKSWFSKNVAPKFTTNFWKTKFNTIKDGAKAAFNGVISIIESAINSIVRKVNTVSWKIPSWVPKYGGTSFGFNLKTISIPRLAEGGIAVDSTIANIGERGKEAILPLENNTGWMDALADKIAARNRTPAKIVLKVGERELGWATIDSINDITKQTGGLQLQLV